MTNSTKTTYFYLKIVLKVSVCVYGGRKVCRVEEEDSLFWRLKPTKRNLLGYSFLFSFLFNFLFGMLHGIKKKHKNKQNNAHTYKHI